jgi:hypothetical protein
MAPLLWARFALLAAIAALIAGYVFVGLRKRDE